MKTEYKNLRKHDEPDRPLRVEIKNKVLTISIGVSTLAFTVEDNCQHELRRNDGEPRYKITNNDGFAEDVRRELTLESEDGTMPIHLLIDAACEKAIENGSAFVEGLDIPAVKG